MSSCRATNANPFGPRTGDPMDEAEGERNRAARATAALREIIALCGNAQAGGSMADALVGIEAAARRGGGE